MKNPLHYQFTEYDCGPTSMRNAVGYLFDREIIPPDIIRNITLYCLDTIGNDGSSGTLGTSRMAMMFLSSWLDGYGKTGRFPISSQYLHGEEVYIGSESRINDTLCRGGAVVARLYLENTEHYVMMSGDTGDAIRIFDPYLCTPAEDARYRVDEGHPCEYNRIVPYEMFNNTTSGDYSLGEHEYREAVLLFNTDTVRTPEKTIEYFI